MKYVKQYFYAAHNCACSGTVYSGLCEMSQYSTKKNSILLFFVWKLFAILKNILLFDRVFLQMSSIELSQALYPCS